MDVVDRLHDDLDKGALQLMAEHRTLLLAEAKRLCGNLTDAEELVIRTLDKAIRRIDSFSGEGDITGWMKSIMTNLHIDDQRRHMIRGTFPADAETIEACAGADNGTDEEIIRNSDRDALKVAIDRLDPAYKKVVILHYFRDYPLKQIAAILNVPIGTVSWRLSVARQMLAEKLGAEFGRKGVAACLTASVLCLMLGAWSFWPNPAVEPLQPVHQVAAVQTGAASVQASEGFDAENALLAETLPANLGCRRRRYSAKR